MRSMNLKVASMTTLIAVGSVLQAAQPDTSTASFTVAAATPKGRGADPVCSRPGTFVAPTTPAGPV
jgi:hypothetical protein